MALSFTLNPPSTDPTPNPTTKRTVLVTGAEGRIGSHFAQHAHHKYHLTLLVRSAKSVPAAAPFGKVLVHDLADLPALTLACHNIDTVLHLAAQARPNAQWDDLLHNNIIGTYNIMTAAHAANCRRLIFASSIHAVSAYPKDVQVKTSDPPNPGDLYGVSKCFGEALGRFMAEKQNLSVIALRIAAYQPAKPPTTKNPPPIPEDWISARDLQQLLEKAIDNTTLRFAILSALSNHPAKHLDITTTRELLGYTPQDDSPPHSPPTPSGTKPE